MAASGKTTIGDDAFQFAYQDSTWTHSGGGGEGAVFGMVVDGDAKADQDLVFNYNQSWQGTSFEFTNNNAYDTDPFRFLMCALTVTAVPSGILSLVAVARRRVWLQTVQM